MLIHKPKHVTDKQNGEKNIRCVDIKCLILVIQLTKWF